MSFINPSAAATKLGVDMSALVAVRDLRSEPSSFDLRYFVQAAEEAGADVVTLAVDATSFKQKRADIDVIIEAVTEVNFIMPLCREMIEFAGTVRPHSVCFAAPEIKHDGPYSDTSLQLINDAVAYLQQQSVRVALALNMATPQLQHQLQLQLQQAVDLGVSTVEFNVSGVVHGDTRDQNLRYSILQTAVHHASQLGLTVNLAHSIEYTNIEQLAKIGEIAQLNVGHAIAVRAMAVGWITAVREMKAALVLAGASSMRQFNEYIAQ